jgi:hypothetical protein
MLTIEQIRAKVDLPVSDEVLMRLRDLIYKTVYGFMGAIK